MQILKCLMRCVNYIGPYENGRVSRYKNVYFNATLNTGKMWLITVLGVISLYETFKRLTLLALKGRLRYTMAVLVISSLHSHYYAWWGHWNHWNDDFYLLWNHQLFFTITELVSTIAVLANADGNTAIKPLSLILVANIALFHILSSGLDQFVKNVVAFQGSLHQVGYVNFNSNSFIEYVEMRVWFYKYNINIVFFYLNHLSTFACFVSGAARCLSHVNRYFATCHCFV